MFDFMRDRNTAEAVRQEILDAYLDNALAPAERAQFEAQLAADARLRSEMETVRALRMQLRAMPHRRVPRSFALDPARHARPKAQPLQQLYPVLRGATALSAFLLIFVLALGLIQGQFAPVGGAPAEVAMSETTDTAAGAELAAPVEEEAAAEAVPREAEALAEESAPAMEMAVAPTEEVGALVPEATTVPAPESDLTFEAAEAESADAGATLEQAAEATPTLEPTPEAITETIPEALATAAPATEATPAEQTRSLLPLQIALGAAFLLSLALWLLARRARI